MAPFTFLGDGGWQEVEENVCHKAYDSFNKAYVHTEEGRELEKTWRQDRFCPHEGETWEHQFRCMPKDQDFVKKWLAGPGRDWQE